MNGELEAARVVRECTAAVIRKVTRDQLGEAWRNLDLRDPPQPERRAA